MHCSYTPAAALRHDAALISLLPAVEFDGE